MNHIYGHPHSKEAEFYKLLLDYDESLERDLADCRVIWYESGTQNLMVGDYGMSDKITSMVISKQFGFIKWLIDNDKIDLYMLDSKAHNTDIIIELYKYENLKDKDSKRLLMLLSISDTPIDLLCSLLK